MMRAAIVGSALALAACGGDGGSGDTSAANRAADARDSAGAAARAPTRVAQVPGFFTPESVRYDERQDVYFVSNVNGNPSQKDGNGSISKVNPETHAVTVFAEGGKNGVTLNAPKGMAIVAGILWVADIDAVRGFDTRTGLQVMSTDLSKQKALFLNDVTVGPDGALYVTDSGIRFAADGSMTHPGPDRVFRIAPDQSVSVALEGAYLAGPNGIAFDRVNFRFVLAPLGGPTISVWPPGNPRADSLVSGPGQYDGVEVLSDGRVLVSSWADSSIYVLRDRALTKLVGGIASPADIGVDTKRHRLLVPSMTMNVVEVWQMAGT